jgi:DNA primase
MRDWVSFSEIKSRVRLDQVLHSYQVDWLRRSGLHQYRGRCPIHQGQGTEAFHANLERGVFHCFACGAGGNVLDFIAAMEGCSIREAALRLQGSPGDGRAGQGEANWLRKKETSTHRWASPWRLIAGILTWPGAGLMPQPPATLEWVTAAVVD